MRTLYLPCIQCFVHMLEVDIRIFEWHSCSPDIRTKFTATVVVKHFQVTTR